MVRGPDIPGDDGPGCAGRGGCGKVNDVIRIVAGEQAAFADPQLAGRRLGALLDAGPRRLLVLDDVWEPDQLAPFTDGGRQCTRLVTTRVPGLLTGRGSEADAIITEARKAAHHLPAGLADFPRFTVTLPQVTLYQVGIWWSLGEPGAALRAARGLHPAQFPTPERRARLLTDLARVWDLAGQPERAIGALLSACGRAASEVRDRPSIRSLASDLVRDHPADQRAQRLGRILDSGGRRQA